MVDVSGGIPIDIRKRWSQLQEQNPLLHNPFFSPDFTAVIASARCDVELAVLEDAGDVVGLFPFERRRWGFAGPVGGRFPVPHGAVCAALLPHVMAANLHALRAREPQNSALARYQKIAVLLTGDAYATAEAGVEWVQTLVAGLPLPRLRDFGLREEAIAGLVAQAANASSMKANPITLTAEELAQTLRRAL